MSDFSGITKSDQRYFC